MVDPASDDSIEQSDPLVRPYVSRNEKHGPEGEQFWSEDLDDAATALRSDALENSGGDLLSNEWRRKAGRERIGGDAGSTHEPLDSGEPHDVRDDHGRSSHDWDRDRRRTYEDGVTDPGGFLGSGWRNGEVPESRRKSVLLRAGMVAAVVVGAVWALTAWIGQPSATSCPPGGCTAKAPAASPKVTAVDDPAATEEPDPGDDLTPVSTGTPASSPRATTSPSATLTKAPPVSPKPTASEASAPAEPKPTPTPQPTRTTATPTATPSSGGGLFGWLF
jgi:hypothetical protein